MGTWLFEASPKSISMSGSPSEEFEASELIILNESGTSMHVENTFFNPGLL
jgi:hypothetical protein